MRIVAADGARIAANSSYSLSIKTDTSIFWTVKRKFLLWRILLNLKVTFLFWTLGDYFSDVYYTLWIDVCPNDGNLLAATGAGKIIQIYDKRALKLIKTFEKEHLGNIATSWWPNLLILLLMLIDSPGNKIGWINCVRWNANGDMLVTASNDKTAKLWDFKTGKMLYTGHTQDGSNSSRHCWFLSFSFNT